MGNDPVDDLLLLVLADIVDRASLMELSLASIVTLLALKHLVDAHILVTACVLVL